MDKIPHPAVWPITKLVIFDCDSTLSSIEGIDELARLSADEDDIALNIAKLTKRAMEGDIPLEAVYGQRLGVVKPTQTQVRHIAKIYRQTVIPNAPTVIEALQTLGVKVFIVSGGLIEPVRDFGVLFGNGEARLVQYEPFNVDAYPEGYVVILENEDVPGVIGKVGTRLGRAGINIAQWRYGRDHPGGKAVSFINLDNRISEELLVELENETDIKRARLVYL